MLIFILIMINQIGAQIDLTQRKGGSATIMACFSKSVHFALT